MNCIYTNGECVGCGECSSSKKCLRCDTPISDHYDGLCLDCFAELKLSGNSVLKDFAEEYYDEFKVFCKEKYLETDE